MAKYLEYRVRKALNRAVGAFQAPKHLLSCHTCRGMDMVHANDTDTMALQCCAPSCAGSWAHLQASPAMTVPVLNSHGQEV